MTRWIRRGAVAAAFLVAAAVATDRWIDATALPDLAPEQSVTVLDREGRLLRAYTVADGRWRLPVTPERVDPRYIEQLIAYEDKRFRSHSGVDVLAALRALGQLARSGRVVSGGSTLTMQVARLLEEAPTGRFGAKLRQVRLALALERRLSKDEILGLYLNIAPFGGNIEGVRAATLSYFGKEPDRLTAAEAALLVALPQSPETRRPDRAPRGARAARDRVLDRLARDGILSPEAALAARSERSPTRRNAFPRHAPQLADRLRRAGGLLHHASIDRDLQESLETLVNTRVGALGPGLSAAIVVADHRAGDVLASIGSPDLLDTRRRGFIDMTRAVRSPGSTLKPLIYGLGFEDGLAHPEMLIEDRPIDFGGYVPGNFDRSHRGTVSIREALQASLNIPAVAVLDSVGPAKLTGRLRRAGIEPRLPGNRAPGLAIGLGGIGLTLHDLVALYAAIARGGEAIHLTERAGEAGSRGGTVLAPGAAWQVADILAGVPAPRGAMAGRLAFKTGTSYGSRDAWAIGFDGRHVIGVWIGRPDGAAVPGVIGLDTAAPLLFEAFQRLKPVPDPLPPPPPEVLTLANAELPSPLRRFRHEAMARAADRLSPEIAFPPDGARVDLGIAGGAEARLSVKLRHGTPPFVWLVGGRPVDAGRFEREVSVTPDGPGFLSISVIDRHGATARARVFVE